MSLSFGFTLSPFVLIAMVIAVVALAKYLD